MTDFWAVSIPSAVGLAGIVFTQMRADNRADKREEKAAALLVDQSSVARQREIDDRWFDDRKFAYVEALTAARLCMEHLRVFPLLMPETRVRESTLEKSNASREALNDAAGAFELVASNEASDLLLRLSNVLAVYDFMPLDQFDEYREQAEGLYSQLRQMSRAELGIDQTGSAA